MDMASWIYSLFEQLLNSLDDTYDIVDLNATLQTINVFEQIKLTKKQLQENNIIECMEELCTESPNQYLKYRLEHLLGMWRDVLHTYSSKTHEVRRSPTKSVFEAIITHDDKFFRTKSVPELLHRLLKSFDQNYKVIDMATVLHTIDVFEEIHIPVSQLATTRLVTYVRRLRRKTTNRYLADRLRNLLKKWRDLLISANQSKHDLCIRKDKRKHKIRSK